MAEIKELKNIIASEWVKESWFKRDVSEFGSFEVLKFNKNMV